MQKFINLAKVTSSAVFTLSTLIGCSGVVVDKRESAAIASEGSPKSSANATCAKTALGLVGPATYVGQIKPLIQSRCLGCHNTGIINNYTNDKDVISQGKQIVFSVKSGRMPKGSKLSDDEKALFAAWAAGGYLITETTTNAVIAPNEKLPPLPDDTTPIGAAAGPAAGIPAAIVQAAPSQDGSVGPAAEPAAASTQTCVAAAPGPVTPAAKAAEPWVAPAEPQNDAGTTANSTGISGSTNGNLTNGNGNSANAASGGPGSTTIGSNTGNASAITLPTGSAQASANAGSSSASASASSSSGNK